MTIVKLEDTSMENQSQNATQTVAVKSDQWIKALQVTSLVVLSTCGLLLNGLAIHTFYRRRSLLSSSRKFVINQMIANLLICLILLPLSTSCVALEGWPLGDAACLISGILHITLVTTCTLSLMFIATDRYFSVVMAMRYRSLMKKRFVTVLVASVWIVGGAMGIGPISNWNSLRYDPTSFTCSFNWTSERLMNKIYAGTLFCVAFLLPLVVMSVVYTKLFIVSYLSGQKLRENASLGRRSSVNESLSSTGDSREALESEPVISNQLTVPSINRCHSSDSMINYSQKLKPSLSRTNSCQLTRPREKALSKTWPGMNDRPGFRFKRRLSQLSITNPRRGSLVYQISGIFHRDNRKAAKTGVLIMLSFLICWTPYFVINLMRTFSDFLSGATWVNFMTLLLAYSNCVVNPIIYVFRNKSVRRQLIQVTKRWRHIIQVKCCQKSTEFNDIPQIITFNANECSNSKRGSMSSV